MDDEDSEDGDGEEATTDDDDTPAVVNGINNRSFPCKNGKDGAESAVATVSCQSRNGGDGGDEDDENDDRDTTMRMTIMSTGPPPATYCQIVRMAMTTPIVHAFTVIPS